MAIATIFLAVELPLPNLPGDLTKALIAYTGVHAIAHGILVAQVFVWSNIETKFKNTFTLFQTMKRFMPSRLSGTKNKNSNGQEQKNGSMLLKLVSYIYFLFVWSFSIAFVVIIFKSRPEKK